MTVDPNHWKSAEYCAFYDSTGCNRPGIEGYTCSPECLSSCPDAFCDTFSSLYYCGGDVDQDEKAIIEGSCLSSVADSVPTSTIMNFSSAVDFKNIDRDSFLADQTAQDVAMLTLSNFVSGIPLNKIRIISITSLESTRRLLRKSDHRQLAVIGSTVTYEVSAVLEELGFESSESEECFNSLVNQIDQSIEYGQFEATLVLNSNHVGSSFMDPVVVDESSTSTIEAVVMVETVVPTSMPSGVPVPSDDDLSEGDVIAISILVPFAVIALAAGAYYWFVHRHKDSGHMDKKSMLGGSIGVDSSVGAKFDDL